MSLQRKQLVAEAFAVLLDHQRSVAASALSHAAVCLSPQLFLHGAQILTACSDAALAAMKADIAAEFLVDEDAAAHGITREYAARRFDVDKQRPLLRLSDWLYFFGVEDPEEHNGDAGAVASTVRDPNTLCRSTPLASSGVLNTLKSVLAADAVFLQSANLLLDEEGATRASVSALERTTRNDVQSSFRRQWLAANLRNRLEEDRAAARRDDAVRRIDDAVENDAAELQRIRWEQAAVSKSIETNRSDAAKLEYSLQCTHAHVLRCGDEVQLLRRYKDTLVDLTCSEVRDGYAGLRSTAATHAAKWDHHMEHVTDRLLEVGRTLLLASATTRGKKAHTETLELLAKGVNGKRRDKTDSVEERLTNDEFRNGDYSWLIADEPLDHVALDDQSLAAMMLRDPTHFVAPSLSTGTSTRGAQQAQGLLQASFDVLRRRSSACDLLVSDRSEGTVPCIPFELFNTFVHESGLAHRLSGVSWRLEFESFATRRSHSMMDVAGWCRCMTSQANLILPRFARELAEPVVLELFCKTVLEPWLTDHSHVRASTTDAGHLERSGVASVPHANRAQRPMDRFALLDLIQEGVGSLAVCHLTVEDYLKAFSESVEHYPAAASVRSVFLTTECLMGLPQHDGPPQPVQYKSVSLAEVAQCAGLAAWRRGVAQWTAATGDVSSGSLDACVSWLSLAVPDGPSCPQRHVVLFLVADTLVRIAQHSLTMSTGASLRHASHETVSSLLFPPNVDVLPALDMSESSILTAASSVAQSALDVVECAAVPSTMLFAAVVALSHEWPAAFPLDAILEAQCRRW